jgi:chromosome segregation ATPase
VQALQRAMNDHTTQLQLREKREATLLRQFEEEQTKRHDCMAQLSSAWEEIRTLQEQREGKFDEMNLHNKTYSSDLKEEVTKLNLELNQAQQKYAESNEHLVKAEDYIVEL